MHTQATHTCAPSKGGLHANAEASDDEDSAPFSSDAFSLISCMRERRERIDDEEEKEVEEEEEGEELMGNGGGSAIEIHRPRRGRRGGGRGRQRGRRGGKTLICTATGAADVSEDEQLGVLL